jgi:hydroxymethylbilane synthase
VKSIIIGTRGSDLALRQANFIKSRLAPITSYPIHLTIIKTQGDKIDNLSFAEMEGKGFFTKEIEEALLANRIDIAVHSLKDLMTSMPDGLALTAVGFRADNRELLLVRPDSYDGSRPLKIKSGGVIGSSSVRRQCQIAHLSPDLKLEDLRGNVPTRVKKLRDGRYDAIIIALAGVRRLELNLSDLHSIILDQDEFLPAPGQGILGIQTRAGDDAINDIVTKLDDASARIQTELERGLMARFEGGCQLPLGAYSEIIGENLNLTAVLGVRKDNRWVGLKRASSTGTDPTAVVDDVYRQLSSDI